MMHFSDLMPQHWSSHRLASGKRACVPEGQRVYAIGDVHGRADLLENMLATIDAQASETDHEVQIIFLGDYVDRGPSSAAVIEQLARACAGRSDIICLKGNHEDSMLGFIEDPAEHVSWLDWGGEETLNSYGVNFSAAREVQELATDLRQAMPVHHVDFLQGLSIRHTVGDYLFVHAGLRPGVALEEQTEKDQLWIRGEFHKTDANQRPDMVIVHGHQSAKKVVDKGWRICVDTGAVWTGSLTAVVLEGSAKRFLSVNAERGLTDPRS